MRRLAVLSLHTSPLAQPGTGDGGGMNVYVRELTAALARSGVACDVFTRAWSPDLPPVVDVEPGLRVHHVPAGPLDRAAQGVAARPSSTTSPPGARAHDRGAASAARAATARPALHLGARQLLALGAVGPRDQARAEPAARVHLPHARSGQGRVHARGGRGGHAAPAGRGRGVHHRVLRRRAGVVHGRGRTDRLALRRRSRAHPHRPARRRPRLLRPGTPPPGAPCARAAARRAPAPLRGPDPAAQVRRRGDRDTGRAARVGLVALPPRRRGRPERAARREGAAGPARSSPTPAACASTCTSSSPQPHELLSSYYRAADVCIVPSRSESFGLVALEAAACGTPVVASAVGGLTTLVDQGHTGFLVEDPDPGRLRRRRAQSLRRAAVGRAPLDCLGADGPPLHLACRGRRRWWTLHDELAAGRLVECS